MAASWCGHTDTVRFLLEKGGADAKAQNDEAIVGAAWGGHIEVMRILLEHRANPAARTNAAIMEACQNGHVEVVSLLLKHGADPTAQDNAPIMIALDHGQLDVVELLLGNGVDPSEQIGEVQSLPRKAQYKLICVYLKPRESHEWKRFVVAHLILLTFMSLNFLFSVITRHT